MASLTTTVPIIPAVALGRQIVQRHRAGLTLLASYMALLTLAARFAPKHVVSTGVIYGGAVVFGFGILYLMGIFTHPEADVAGTSSGYPSHLLTLPVRTRDLVLWPMLYGTVTVGSAWIGLTELVLHGRGAHVAAAWPAAMLVAMLAALQALFWSPVGLPYLRLALSLVVLWGLLTFGVAATLNGASEGAVVGWFALVAAASYLAALNGVARARRGDARTLAWLPERAVREAPSIPDAGAPAQYRRRLRPFTSGPEAQLWAEWTRNGLLLPFLSVFACALFSCGVLSVAEVYPLWTLDSLSTAPIAYGPSRIEANTFLCIYFPGFLLVVPAIAAIVGCGLRKADTRRADGTLPLHLSTRPLTSLQMVQARWRMALRSAYTAWGIMTLFMLAWLMSPAKLSGETKPLLVHLASFYTPDVLVVIPLVLLLLVGLTWRNQVIGLCADLAGRSWVSVGYAATFGIPIIGVVMVSNLVNEGRVPLLIRILLGCAWTSLALKGLAAAWAARRLLHARLASPRFVIGVAAGWAALVALVFVLGKAVGQFVLLALRNRLSPPLSVLAEPQTLFLFAALVVPLARLLLAPLALDWNRHR